MKKLLSLVLALVMVMSLATVAMAANTNPSFTKTYSAPNGGTSPEETFTFTFTPVGATGTDVGAGDVTLPAIDPVTTYFAKGTATAEGLAQTITVDLSDIEWPSIGVYTYDVEETAGSTGGVTYDGDTLKMKVTVAYDDDGAEYYVAFVTMSFKDANDDGISDVKTGGFQNVYNVGDLKITKTVAGNMGDKTKYFPFTVQLTGEPDKTYADSYAVEGGSYESNPKTIAVGATATFYLKHGETLTIADLPAGISYEIVETAANTEGYITAVSNSDGDGDVESTTEGDTTTYTGKATGSIDAGDDITVAYTNTKGTTVDTGIVLDSMPYILMLAVACMGLVVVFTKKRRAE